MKWLLFVLALVALGVAIHFTAPAWPRWRTHVPGDSGTFAVKLTPDGRLVTMPFGLERGSGPLTVLDAEKGRELVSAWKDNRQAVRLYLSPSGNWAAGTVGVLDGHALLRVIDTRDGAMREIPLGGDRSDDHRLRYSADEGRVFVERRGKDVRAFDLATGRPVEAQADGPFDDGEKGTLTSAAGDGYRVTVRDIGAGWMAERWDTVPPKPWAWSVGLPLAVGAVVLAARRKGAAS